MTALVWDEVGKRYYETGVDHGVLYQIDENGEYSTGEAWNGLTTVTESPSGAEPNKVYADNIVYLNLTSVEEFNGTIEAFTYPLSFEQNDGYGSPTPGVTYGQQRRRAFGFSYRTRLGNDIEDTDYGYKLHLVYGAKAAPSERAYATINDSPEASPFSWEISTTPVVVGTVNGVEYKPLASITIDSTTVDPAKLAILEAQLYGTTMTDPSMPMPADVYATLGTVLTLATPTEPAFNQGTNTITIPTVTGVIYKIGTVTKAPGAVVITTNTVVKAYPAATYKFPVPFVNQWYYPFV